MCGAGPGPGSRVAVDPQGNATAVSSRDYTTFATGHDAAGPRLRGVSIRALGAAEMAAWFAVSPQDA
jgi:hypothetical protein